jgi:hypothetical protein
MSDERIQAAPREAAARVWSRLSSYGREQVRLFFAPEAFRYILHCSLLLVLVVLLRPLFMSTIPDGIYEARSIAWELTGQDVDMIVQGAKRHRPVVLRLLYLAIPTAIFLLSRRRLRWDDWEHGRALRGFVMTLLVMMAWSGATADYNIYLDRLHGSDRLLLVLFTALSWRTPLAVPFATRWAYVMIKEAYVPIPLDDFDFRPVAEVLVVFSIFVWASFRRTMNTRHFLLVGVGAWASYYYAAGYAKLTYGPEWSWLLDNHVTSLAVGGHVRGWLAFLREDIFIGFIEFARRFDVALQGFTLVVELGALAAFFLHPRLARLWFWLCFLLHFGIYVLSGVFFWKWMVANVAFYLWLRLGGAPVLETLSRYKLVVLFGALTVFYSRERIWYWPQTRVVWYDSRLVEDFDIYAVGVSGERYLVNPSWLTPMEMHWVQGRLCYATTERSLTGIYGTTGSLNLIKQLESIERPEDVLKLYGRARSCNDPKRRKVFDDFMRRYFSNLNRRGRPHRWISWIGRPTHLWVQPQGRLYDLQEPVKEIELWRTLIVHHGGALHNVEEKRVRQLSIED